MGLHPEIPLVAFLGLMHFGITLALAVLRRARRGDQRSVHHRAGAQQQPLLAQQVVDHAKDLLGQLVPLQQTAKPQNRRLVGQSSFPVVQLSELAKQRHVVQRFLHGRVAQREPLLHEMDAQHRLHGKRWTAAAAVGRIGRHQFHQCGPWHHAVHLFQELALSRSLGRKIQPEVSLLHSLDVRSAHLPRLYAEVP